jgi:hypothetical protein|tara:strand:- start:601 stop:1104 length:504 start_codon:yes stop_codon:yes gene_type:complete
MARFATGKDSYGISDRSGFRYRLREMRREWNGALVGPDEYEAKHPQLHPQRSFTDAEAIRNARPDRTEPAVEQILEENPFKSGSSGSSVITVLEKNHGRSNGDTVRFRKALGFDGFTEAVIESASGYVITIVDANNYTFSATSGTATVGSQSGGGKNATAGPVTLED